ncbi:hypothetical protein HJC99_04095 [Candidatus Saccharibacteria bacterium]|nr:hypothetical protein [Candidatus Saccharibacteria bacterium]
MTTALAPSCVDEFDLAYDHTEKCWTLRRDGQLILAAVDVELFRRQAGKLILSAGLDRDRVTKNIGVALDEFRPMLESHLEGYNGRPAIYGLKLDWDPLAKAFEVYRSGYTRSEGASGTRLIYTTDDLDQLLRWVQKAAIKLERERRRALLVDNVVDAIAEQVTSIPYPQDCQCEDYENGLRAFDCHVHEAKPHHFIGDFDFDCTCPGRS